jgi:hypothetical protein
MVIIKGFSFPGYSLFWQQCSLIVNWKYLRKILSASLIVNSEMQDKYGYQAGHGCEKKSGRITCPVGHPPAE